MQKICIYCNWLYIPVLGGSFARLFWGKRNITTLVTQLCLSPNRALRLEKTEPRQYESSKWMHNNASRVVVIPPDWTVSLLLHYSMNRLPIERALFTEGNCLSLELAQIIPQFKFPSLHADVSANKNELKVSLMGHNKKTKTL